ncbi:MAG: SCO family protein [Rhodocyclaceae bacterium]|nr:SCO family protein [Rhodocyclaceae bacterium]
MKLAALLAAVLLLSAPAFAADDEELLPAGIVPRYLLRDANGRAVTEGDFAGRFQLVSFGYTYCPDVCPTTLVEMADILKRLGDQAARLQAIFISVDPERDTAEVLKNYTAFFDARIIGLTGPVELVRSAANRFKVRYEKVREPGAPANQYSVDHSAGIYLLGPDGGFLVKFAYQTPPADVVERVRELMAQAPPPRR